MEGTKQTCIFIIGMHRSGTSALAGCLNILGIHPGKDLLPPTQDNPKGYFENLQANKLNDEILSSINYRWYTSFFLDESLFTKEQKKVYIQNCIDILKRDLEVSNTILIKDPRISILLPFWQQACKELKLDVKYIIVLRNPLEIAHSLKKRNKFDLNKSYTIWYNYLLSAEKSTRNQSRLFVKFDELMQNPIDVLDNLTTQFKLNYPFSLKNSRDRITKFLEPSLKHHNLKDTTEIPAKVKALYNELLTLAKSDRDYQSIDQVMDNYIEDNKFFYHNQIAKVDLANSASLQYYQVQLYYDTGNGFSEKETQKNYINFYFNECIFPLHQLKTLKGLRFDPANTPLLMELKSCFFLTKEKTKIDTTVSSNALLTNDNTFLFDTNDPNMIINLEGIDTSKIDSFHIQYQIKMMGDAVTPLAELIHNNRKLNHLKVENKELLVEKGMLLALKEEFKGKIEQDKVIIQQRERIIEQKENMVQEKAIQEKEQIIQLQEKEKAIQEKEKVMQQKEKALEQKAHAVEEKEEAIQRREQAIQLQQKEHELKLKEQTIEQKERELLLKTEAINQKEEAILLKNKKLEEAKYKSVLLHEKNSQLQNTIALKERFIHEVKRSNESAERLLEKKRQEIEELRNKRWYQRTNRSSKKSNPVSSKLQIISGLVVMAMRSPLQTLKNLSPRNLLTLGKALRSEDQGAILNNYENLLTQKNKPSPSNGVTGNKQAVVNTISNNNAVPPPPPVVPKNCKYHIETFDINDQNQLSMTGWFIHKEGFDNIALYNKDNFVSLISLNILREDIAENYPTYENATNSGTEVINLQLNDSPKHLILKCYTIRNTVVEIPLNSFVPIDKQEVTKVNNQADLLAAQKYYQKPHPEYYQNFSKKNKLSLNIGDLKYITFYLPQFHQIPENDEWWGKGFTEWTNVTQSFSKFKGHFQPRLPGELGFYDLSNIEVIKRQVELAINYGIYGFCFHYYWFSGRRLLEKPVDLFLESDIDFNFCLCWANENWTRRWDGQDTDILLAQEYSEKDPENFVKDILPYVSDERYIKIGGKHLIIVYRPAIIPDIKNTVKRWRKHFLENDINPLFVCAQGFGLSDPKEVGFDVAVEFPPHKIAVDLEKINKTIDFYDKDFEGNIYSYDDLIDRAQEEPVPAYPLIRGITPSWDNDARRKGKGSTSYSFSTPNKFKKWLNIVSDYALKNPVLDESLVFINAWNEWAEGAYLEPDRHFGYAYLDTSYEVLATKNNINPSNSTHYKCILVSHDAHKHGAQLITLNIAKTIKKQFGFDAVVLLLEGGDLEVEFQKVTKTINLSGKSKEEQLKIFKDLHKKGFEKALCNTTVSGKIIEDLSNSGMSCMALIHELPVLIKNYKLEPAVANIAKYADKIIFPSDIVKEGFFSFLDKPPLEKAHVSPQGCYKFDLDKLDDFKKGKLRQELQLKDDDIIIGGLGYADHRKGIDLFIQIAELLNKDIDSHFVWIGGMDLKMKDEIKKQLKPVKDRVHFVPFKFDVENYIIDFDIFLLTSREDPFPTVVQENLALGVPVIAFEGGGGIVELNRYGEIILLAKYLDVEDMTRLITTLLKDKAKIKGLSERGIQLIKEKFRYDTYCYKLMNFMEFDLKKISVVVPNYNYSDVLEERLASIWNQDYPIFEMIVLDDKSPDDSVRVIQQLSKKYKRTIRLFVNEQNSGSVFKQWHKGAEIARGEFIWIAEADDSSETAFLSTLLTFFEKDTSLGMAYTQSKQIDENGKYLANDYHYYTDEIDTRRWHSDYICVGEEEIKQGLSVRNTILNVSSVLFNAEQLKPILDSHLNEILANYKVCGDWFVYLKILANNKIAYSAEPLNIHRRHSNSVTKQNNHLDEVQNIHEIVIQKYNLDDYYRQKMEKEIDKLDKLFNA